MGCLRRQRQVPGAQSRRLAAHGAGLACRRRRERSAGSRVWVSLVAAAGWRGRGVTGPTHAQQAAQQAACETGRPTKAAASALQLPAGWPAAVLLDTRAPSAVYRPSPHVYKKALTLGSMTWQRKGKNRQLNVCQGTLQQAQCCRKPINTAHQRAVLQANKHEARRGTSWLTCAAHLCAAQSDPRSMIEHEPENASDQQQGMRSWEPLTCARRTSATRNMNFRMPSRRVMTALSEM